jgi:serine/threonine-protein kinase
MTIDLLGQERYVVEQPLGQGAMGTVLLARDTVLHRVVAVKVLADHLAADDGFRRRFIQEARLAARLCHPNIVQLFDAGDDGRPFLVMEYVDGETVADRLARRVEFSADELIGLATQLSAGLAHAHARGIVHRDVKPHNVLLRRDGVAKLTDFGIARAVEEAGLTEIGTIVGTAAYMAPEQAAGQPVGPAADVYGLGAVLRQLAGGSLPPELESLVNAALAPDPAARPSAADVHDQLVAMADRPTAFVPPPAAVSSETAPTEIVSRNLVGPPAAAAPIGFADVTEPDTRAEAAPTMFADHPEARTRTEATPTAFAGHPEAGTRPEAAPTVFADHTKAGTRTKVAAPSAFADDIAVGTPTEVAPRTAFVDPTEVATPAEVRTPAESATSPSRGQFWMQRLDPGAWWSTPAAVVAALVLLGLLALSVTMSGPNRAPAASRSATPVPTGADPAQTAHNLATWLRGQSD